MSPRDTAEAARIHRARELANQRWEPGKLVVKLHNVCTTRHALMLANLDAQLRRIMIIS